MTLNWLNLAIGFTLGAILGVLADWQLGMRLRRWSELRALTREYGPLAGQYVSYRVRDDGTHEPTGGIRAFPCARRPLPGQRLQLRPRVHAHRGARRADVVQPLDGALLGQNGLSRSGGLIDLRRGGGVPLGGVGHGLLGRVVGAGDVEHLPAEPFDEPTGIGLRVGQRGRVAPA